MYSAEISFLYGVAESLYRTTNPERLKLAARAEAKDFLTETFLEALEKLFELKESSVAEAGLQSVVRQADLEHPSADALAAAAYLRAAHLEKRRSEGSDF